MIYSFDGVLQTVGFETFSSDKFLEWLKFCRRTTGQLGILSDSSDGSIFLEMGVNISVACFATCYNLVGLGTYYMVYTAAKAEETLSYPPSPPRKGVVGMLTCASATTLRHIAD